jgi:hypothetical protein
MNYKILLTAVFIILMSASVLAVPGIPHQFWGAVTVNGQPASDGLTVTAKINGVEVKSTTTSGGEYNLIIDDPFNDRSGDAVNFFVEGKDTDQSLDYCNGCVNELDLSATIEGGSPGGGSPGGGPSGGGKRPRLP